MRFELSFDLRNPPWSGKPFDRFYADFLDLVEWAAADPLADGWGATALVPYALWRWTEYALETDALDPAEVDSVLAAEQKLRHTKLVSAVSSYPVLDTLPQLREASLLSLALLAQRTGRIDAARLLFQEHLSVASQDALGDGAAELRDGIVRDGWATAATLDLLRANRLWQLGHFGQAGDVFDLLTDSSEETVRHEARLNQATLRFETHDDDLSLDMRRSVAEMLNRTIDEARDPRTIERAYYQRGRLWRREGSAQSNDEFVRAMEALVREFPAGRYAADALYELAQYAESEYRRTLDDAALASALDYYRQICDLPLPHTREDSMYFRPALALYTRGAVRGDSPSADLRQASGLLATLSETRPSGPFFMASLFWRARIATLLEREEEAVALYEELARMDPLGYYGIRALMHLVPGVDPRRQLLPIGGARRRLACSIPDSVVADDMGTSGPYRVRIRSSIDSARYGRALRTLQRFRDRTAIRLQDASLLDLDARGELADIVVLLALRQDAVAARDRDRSAENVVDLANIVGQRTGDWPLAFSLLPSRAWSLSDARDVREHQGYVSAAYPRLHIERFTEVAARFDLMPALLYSVARRESLFDPRAVSAVGAMGLYQFMPNTFRRLDRRWDLLIEGGVSSRAEYLADEARSIELAGRYLREELLRRYTTEQGLLLALMDHSGGSSAVGEWLQEWNAVGLAADIEYMVETARFVETRILLRGILADLAVVDAAGLFGEADPACHG